MTQAPFKLPMSKGWILFVVFTTAVVAAYFWLLPGWGFMDDAQCRVLASKFWAGERTLPDIIAQDAQDNGRFRPLYFLWIVLIYAVPQPLIAYLLIFVLTMAVLIGWGRTIVRLFPEENGGFARYVYPLFFFTFLPMWNVCMYISVQEKFVFLFSSVSFFCLVKSYAQGSGRLLAAALLIAAAGVLGKETGMTVLGAYAAFALLDILFLRANPRLSVVLLLTSIGAAAVYFFVIKALLSLGQYSGPYKSNLTLQTLAMRFGSASVLIKLLMGLGIVTAGAAIVRRSSPVFLICPFFVVIYIILLLPWGYPNYLLAPLAPWVMMCLYFWVSPVLRHRRGGPVVKVVVAAMVLVTLCFDIIPRIGKMADKRKVAEAAASLRTEGQARFFYPMPFEEAGAALEVYSGAQVRCVFQVSAADLIAGRNFVVINDEAGPIGLNDVGLGSPVYRNGTWVIYPLQPKPGNREEFAENIVNSPLKALKNRIYNF